MKCRAVQLERSYFPEDRARAVRELERRHFLEQMPTSQPVPGLGSAVQAGPGHIGSPAAAAKRSSITFPRLQRRTQLAARRLRRW